MIGIAYDRGGRMGNELSDAGRIHLATKNLIYAHAMVKRASVSTQERPAHEPLPG